MMWTFVWLDYSECERRKMLDVVDLFREHDTRNELGVGSVRKAFADMLFHSVFQKPDPTRMKTPAVGWTARFLYLSVERWI